jgi:serine/threonine protein kinase/Tol biopolymer transport system component
MTPERWRQVEGLFQAALRLPPEERDAFVDEECAADPELRSEALSMLEADARAGSFLRTPTARPPLEADERGPAPGERLGPYEIVGRLGQGGMGEVYRARDPRLGREVAIKVLTPRRAPDRDARARFEREARTASALNHPHIVNIYEIGEAETLAGSTYYIAMELVEGQTLRERLKGGAGWRDLVLPLAQVADALAKAHKAGIVHRDLKPENIMLTPDGYPKVLDFGLAKLMGVGEAASAPESAPTRSFEGHTRAGTILGTPGYMSPEQVQGKPLDSRSDIFSLGCILYEAAAGRRPFKGDSELETLYAIVHHEPPPVESLGEAPPELGRLVRRCLAKDRDERYQAITDLAHDLRELGRDATPSLAPRVPARPGRKSWARWLTGGVVTAGVVIGVGRGLRSPAERGASSAGRTPGLLQVEKLTSRGDVSHPTISPNGRHLAYASPDEAGATVWLRDLSERTEARLVPPMRAAYLDGIRFGPDGQAVYYSFRESGARESAVYKVPLIGGDPRLVAADASLDELSPDGTHVARSRRRGGQWTLLIEELEGGQERALGEPAPQWLHAWSPDGSRLLFGRVREGRQTLSLVNADGTAERTVAGLSRTPAEAWWRPDGAGAVLALYEELYESTRLFDLALATGATRALADRLFRPQALEWLPDGRAFVLNDTTQGGGGALYLVSYPDGRVERIPGDTHAYEGLGATGDGAGIVSVQSVERSDILVSTDSGSAAFKKVVSGTDVTYRMCWTADGRLVYGSNDGGSYDLYVSDTDGSNPKQLTFDRDSDETQPAASPDGRFVVFVSDRSGEQGLFRINRDGTGLRSLTPKPEPHYRDYDPHFTPDGQWVLYRHWDNGPSLWKVPVDGGRPVLVKGARPPQAPGPVESAFGATASPDGRSLAFFYWEQDPGSLRTSWAELALASLDGRIVRRFPLPTSSRSVPDAQRVQWSRDGRTLYYNLFDRDVGALWKQPLSGGSPVQVTHFEEPLQYFDWSFDGRALAVSRSSTLSDVVMITNFR